MRHDAWVGMLWRSCQTSVAHSCRLLNHLNSFHGGMLKFNAKFNADSLLYLLSHFECHGHTIHVLSQWCPSPHWRVQWSCHCSHMCIPVHSPWLPGFIVILTMAGLFPDRPCKLGFYPNITGLENPVKSEVKAALFSHLPLDLEVTGLAQKAILITL